METRLPAAALGDEAMHSKTRAVSINSDRHQSGGGDGRVGTKNGGAVGTKRLPCALGNEQRAPLCPAPHASLAP